MFLFLISCQNKSNGSFIANTSIIPKPQIIEIKAGYLEASKFILMKILSSLIIFIFLKINYKIIFKRS